MPRFTTSSTTYGAFYARPQALSAGVKKPTVAIDNPYANSLTGIDAVLADRGLVRLESAAAAAEIAGAVAGCYERYGYTVVRVPPLPPAARLAFVLQAAGVFPKFVQ